MGAMVDGPESEGEPMAEPEQVLNGKGKQIKEPMDDVVPGEDAGSPSHFSVDESQLLKDSNLSRNEHVVVERPSESEQAQDMSAAPGQSRPEWDRAEDHQRGDAEVQESAGQRGRERWPQDSKRRLSSREVEDQERADQREKERWPEDSRRRPSSRAMDGQGKGELKGRERWSQDTRRRPPGREVESPDWRKGKRERNSPEKSAGDDERHWKRRRSEDGRHSSPALPLSPDDLRFSMGARGSPRGSPRDTRRARLQQQQPLSEEVRRCTLYVGDLDLGTTKHDLRRAFECFGEIDLKESRMITGQCYGFVTFRSRSDAETALQSESSITVLGRRPYISWAQGAMPAWKIGVGGFVIDPTVGIIDKRDALSRAAEAAAATAAAALQEKQRLEGQSGSRGRQLVAYDDLF